jgi:competence protein ComEA
VNARVTDAIDRAGGLRPDADPVAVNLAERISDGEEIRVPRAGEASAPPRRSKRKAPRSRAASAAPIGRIDLNLADASELSSIPGIGPVLASRIVEFRRVNGPFASLDELADVAGMTQRRIDALSTYVTVGS